jgi:hypothetical protein
MRKFLFSLLLASTFATPVLAAPQDSGAAFRQERQAERSQARQERQAERSQVRQERAEARQERAQVREDRSQAARQERVDMRQQRFDARQQQVEAAQQRMRRSDTPVREVERYNPGGNVNGRGRPALDQRQDRSDSVADWQRGRRDGNSNWQRDRRDGDRQNADRRGGRDGVRIPVGARPDRPAPVPSTAYNRTRHPEWRTDWRRDHRYDWSNYRNQHRSIFRLGVYYDPFGWGYRRYNVGWRLWPSYYGSNYWLNDPYMYRLPYAPWPFKWVRYYDDALLVNTMTGQIVDVMYDFFW